MNSPNGKEPRERCSLDFPDLFMLFDFFFLDRFPNDTPGDISTCDLVSIERRYWAL